jgi:hypothetical protein
MRPLSIKKDIIFVNLYKKYYDKDIRKMKDEDIVKSDIIGIYKDYSSCLNSALSYYTNIPDYFNVIGYGSLLKLSDAQRTMPSLEKVELGYIKGYRRIFNLLGTTGNYLNVYHVDSDEPMPVAYMKIKQDEIYDFAFRERRYQLELTTLDSGEEALILLANDSWIDYNQPPILTYLLLCMTGAHELGWYKVLNEFINTTDTNFGPLERWLKTSQLEGVINYIIRNGHTSR